MYVQLLGSARLRAWMAHIQEQTIHIIIVLSWWKIITSPQGANLLPRVSMNGQAESWRKCSRKRPWRCVHSGHIQDVMSSHDTHNSSRSSKAARSGSSSRKHATKSGGQAYLGRGHWFINHARLQLYEVSMLMRCKRQNEKITWV